MTDYFHTKYTTLIVSLNIKSQFYFQTNNKNGTKKL